MKQDDDVVIEATSKAAVEAIESLSSRDDRDEQYNVNLASLHGAAIPTAVYTSVLHDYCASPSFYISFDHPRETIEPTAAGGVTTLSRRISSANAQGDTSAADIKSVNHGKRNLSKLHQTLTFFEAWMKLHRAVMGGL